MFARDPRGARLRAPLAADAARARGRHRREHRRVQLPRDPAAARVGHARSRPRGLRHPLRLLRRRRARSERCSRPRSAGRAGRCSSLGTGGFSLALLALVPIDSVAPAAAPPLRHRRRASRSGRRTRTRSCSSAHPTTCAAGSSASTSGPSPGSRPIGGLLAGWLTDVGGTPLAFAVAGLTGLAMTFAAAGELRRRRNACRPSRSRVVGSPLRGTRVVRPSPNLRRLR